MRKFEELKDTGLLWLINRVILHPRGYALGLVYENGAAVGWDLIGDGSEPKAFEHESEKELFDKVAELLA